MSRLKSDILIVGGGAAGMSAAVAASIKRGANVTIADDNPRLGGQIWRAELGKTKSPDAIRLITAVEAGRINIINNAQVFAAAVEKCLHAETPGGTIEFEFEKLLRDSTSEILPPVSYKAMTSTRSLFIVAASSIALISSTVRMSFGPTVELLLAVAEYLKSKGASVVAIAEQASSSKLIKFAFGLWRSPSKLAQAIGLWAKLRGEPYLTDCWVTSASNECGSPSVSKGLTSNVRVTPLLTRGLPHLEPTSVENLKAVTLTQKGKTWSVNCDYLACGFHLVPNIDLASILNCKIEDGFVAVDEFQLRTDGVERLIFLRNFDRLLVQIDGLAVTKS